MWFGKELWLYIEIISLIMTIVLIRVQGPAVRSTADSNGAFYAT
jgi:hypothetical protein